LPIITRLPINFLRDFSEVQNLIGARQEDFNEVAWFASRDWMNAQDRKFRSHVSTH